MVNIKEHLNKVAHFFLIVFFLFWGCSTSKNNDVADENTPIPKTTFQNPLLDSGPDPWVVQKDGIYYYTHTFGDRIGIYKTKKLSELRGAEKKFIWYAPATGENSKHIWAPELHYLNNRWYMYYTAGPSDDLSNQRSFVLENANEDPMEGEWVEKGRIYDPEADFFAIDGTVFDYKGSYYFLWSGHSSATDDTQRIYIAKMVNPWTLESARSLLSSPTHEWETIGDPHVMEGPEILLNKEGSVFMIYSASGCWTDDYALGMLRLQEDGDPMEAAHWIKHPEPVFSKNPESKAFGPGHNGFFKSPDSTEDWIIYHANPSAGKGCADERSPRMQPFLWQDDGTPDFGEPVKINTHVNIPSGE